MANLSAQITPSGISAPAFSDILAGLQSQFLAIYGSDAYIDPDSQDGQFLALMAQAISDANDAAIAAFNAYAPSSAVGTGLSSIVKTNGIRRLVSSKSTALGTVVGQVGSVITGGVVKDANGYLWDLPASVTIPPAGYISVTVTAQELGAISAPAGTINKINTPSLGWQSFVSVADATPGAPVELDPALRQRQAVSTALPAQTVLGALQGALLNLSGVQKVRIYENTTSATDANGLPSKSISCVVKGGIAADIGTVIGQKKTPGAATYGTTTVAYTDPTTGIPYTIKYFILATSTIKVNVTGTALAGYSSVTGDQIKQALVDYINSHNIGETVEYSAMWAPAYLNQPARLLPYKITALTIAIGAGAPGVADLAIAFNAIANAALTDITVAIS